MGWLSGAVRTVRSSCSSSVSPASKSFHDILAPKTCGGTGNSGSAMYWQSTEWRSRCWSVRCPAQTRKAFCLSKKGWKKGRPAMWSKWVWVSSRSAETRPLALQLLAEAAQARARVEDQQVVAAAHLQAGGVAAVARVVGTRTGDRAAHAPKGHGEIGSSSHEILSEGLLGQPMIPLYM